MHGDMDAANQFKLEGENTHATIKRLAGEAQKKAYEEVMNEYYRITDYEQKIPNYESEEERQNIMYDEQETAHKTGEVPMDQVTRTSHGEMMFYKVESVSSTPNVPQQP